MDGSKASVSQIVPRETWLSVFASDPDALPSQSPQWIQAACSSGAWRDASRFYITDSGRRVILPLLRFGSGPLTALASPRRGWGYGGLIADGGVSADDVAMVSADLAATAKFSLWLRPNPLQSKLWERFSIGARLRKSAHVVDLHGGPEAVRQRLHASAKKGIRTAEKMHVRVETGFAGELLPVFFELTLKARALWAHRQHEPVWLAQLRGRIRDSESKWSAIASHMGHAFQVISAWHEGRPAAAGIVLQAGNAHGTRAAMDPEMRHVGASHLLNWVALMNACAAGARYFHMGESATPGAAAFKGSFGATACPFDEFYFERFPVSRVDALLRSAVKRAIGFKEGAAAEANPGRGHR
jgi:hypothetical protein